MSKVPRHPSGLAGQRSLLDNQYSPGYYAQHQDSRQKRMSRDRDEALRKNPTGPSDFWPKDRDAPWDYTSWKAIKLLGKGGSGICGLYEYQGPSSPSITPGTRIAIKFPNFNHEASVKFFQKEARTMLKLSKRNNMHLLKMLVCREPGALYLEYVPGGDLWRELQNRANMRPPRVYGEVELWRMFLCFAKGVVGMSMVDGERGWWPFLHLDFKPDNIFLARDDNHDCRGNDILYKIADFGWTAELEGYHEDWKLQDHQRQEYRKAGHPKFRTPEQDSEDWLRDDWQTSEICGNWSPQLNVWSMGAVMWQMTMLQYFPPKVAPVLMRTQKYVSGLDPRLSIGSTYGKELESASYSKELKTLILCCMMENPKHRPKPVEVVKSIQDQLDAVDGINVTAVVV